MSFRQGNNNQDHMYSLEWKDLSRYKLNRQCKGHRLINQLLLQMYLWDMVLDRFQQGRNSGLKDNLQELLFLEGNIYQLDM